MPPGTRLMREEERVATLEELKVKNQEREIKIQQMKENSGKNSVQRQKGQKTRRLKNLAVIRPRQQCRFILNHFLSHLHFFIFDILLKFTVLILYLLEDQSTLL